MSTQKLTDDECVALIQVPGGVQAVRELLAQKKRLVDRHQIFTEVVVGGPAFCHKYRLIQQLEARGFLQDDLTRAVLQSPNLKITTKRDDLKLSRANATDLNLPNGDLLANMLAVARSQNLGNCPMDTGIAMVLQMSGEWTKKTRIYVVSDVIMHDDLLWWLVVSPHRLQAVPIDMGQHYSPSDEFLYRLM